MRRDASSRPRVADRGAVPTTVRRSALYKADSRRTIDRYVDYFDGEPGRAWPAERDLCGGGVLLEKLTRHGESRIADRARRPRAAFRWTLRQTETPLVERRLRLVRSPGAGDSPPAQDAAARPVGRREGEVTWVATGCPIEPPSRALFPE